MSKKVLKLICLDKNYHGSVLILPVVGETKIPKNGIIEIPENVAEMLVSGNDWAYPEDQIADDEEDEEEEENDEESDVSDDSAAVKVQLNALDLPKLLAMAKTAEYPEEEYKSFKKNKALMVNYLVKKSKEDNK